MGDRQLDSAGPNVQAKVWERRHNVARLYCQGNTMREISAQLLCSLGTVCRDMVFVRNKWLASLVKDYDTIKARELAKIDTIETELWAAWSASKKASEKTVSEKSTGITNTSRARVEKENRNGDPRYMAIILQCIERRCRILGIDAPTKIAPTDPDGGTITPPLGGYMGYGQVVIELPHNGREIIDVTPPRPPSATN